MKFISPGFEFEIRCEFVGVERVGVGVGLRGCEGGTVVRWEWGNYPWPGQVRCQGLEERHGERIMAGQLAAFHHLAHLEGSTPHGKNT